MREYILTPTRSADCSADNTTLMYIGGTPYAKVAQLHEAVGSS